jgi:protoporphyrinogen oxidase
MLGYLKGGFLRLYKALADEVENAGGHVNYEDVTRITGDMSGKVDIGTRSGDLVFDKVLFTGAPQELCAISDMPTPYVEKACWTKYKANICMTLIVKVKVSDYYWVTVAEKDAPFVLFIEHTNLVKDPDYGDKHIIYLSRYLDTGDPLFEAPDEQISEMFLMYLSRMFVGFRRESIVDSYISRARYTQPVVGLNYSEHMLPMETPVKNLYLASMAQIYPEDRGQNYAISMGIRAAAAILAKEGGQPNP